MKDNLLPDPLEEFIRQHRAEFDTYEPDPLLWQQISRELSTDAPSIPPLRLQPQRRLLYIHPVVWQAAASIALILGFYTFLYQPNSHPVSTRVARANVLGAASLDKVSPELAQADAYYTRLIHEKEAEMDTAANLDPSLKQDFYQDLTQLDSMYTVLSHDLGDNPNKEQVAAAMIQNLQLRIEILNRQLRILHTLHAQKAAHYAQPV